MRYLINRTTKEHQRMPFDWLYAPSGWSVVQADSEGWIKHEGTECPLPDDVRCEIKTVCEEARSSTDSRKASEWIWSNTLIREARITHYRPIITEKAQEPEPIPAPDYEPRSVSFNPKSIAEMIKESAETPSPCIDVITRLSIAHRSAQQIPDLEAELREVLADMGYDLVARSPFTQQRHGAEGE